MSGYDEGTLVEWDWGTGTARGKIRRKFTSKITKTIKGTEVTREASDDEPAYLIEQDDGGQVIKGHGEIRKTS